MNDSNTLDAVVEQYRTHGWILRRILQAEASRKVQDPISSSAFPNVEVVFTDIDALWFSRASRPGSITWELRRLGGTPYALDAFIDESMELASIEEILANTEERMRSSDTTPKK